jgi:hypothetical protein
LNQTVVTLAASYPATDNFRVKVILAQYDMAFDLPSKAIVETTVTKMVDVVATGSATVIVDAGGLVKSVATLERVANVKTFYAYAPSTNQLVDLVNAVAYGSYVVLTFSGPVTGTFKVPMVVSYALTTADKMQIYYAHKPYQGAFRSGMLQGSRVMALKAHSLTHSVGSGQTNAYLPQNLSTNLPLPYNRSDGYLVEDLLTLTSTGVTGPMVEPSAFTNTQVYLGNGLGLRLGSTLTEQAPLGSPTPPTRGAALRELHTSEGTVAGGLEVQTAALTGAEKHQSVYSALMKTTACELVLLVGTLTKSSSGGDRLQFKQDVDVAWDVFLLPNRPIER